MSHMPEAAYASAAAAAAPDTYATSRQHRASGGAPTANGQHDGSAAAGGNNDFRNAYSQDGFGSNGGGGGGGGGGAHWSQQSPYGNGYPANQFAAPNGSSHPSYPSSTASPYGASSMGHQVHAAPYSGFGGMQAQHGHHRGPAHMHLGSQAYHHDSGPATPNGAGGLSQHATPGGGAGLSGSPAYHSPSIAGMVPGVAHHHGAGAHQGYQSHYSQSMMGQPNSAGALGQAGAINSPGYPSVPQYSTQLPLAGRHRVTTTLWEDEGTLCFQVDAKGVCVARRHDNSMINGTKLLNVCGMSRGKRDGILKNEKERIVVKVGAMHLKGVWITFQRGKQLAEQNGISDLLYPLFEPNIQSFLYHPDNYPRTAAVMAAAQERQNRKIPDNTSPAGMPTAGTASHDQSYDSWAAQRHQANGGGGGGGYISAPVTATQSPSHGAHSGYSTPALPGQQPSTPSANGVQGGGPVAAGSAAQSGLGGGAGGVRGQVPPADRRHSMPLNGQHPQDHPGRAENPYAMPSIDSMQSHSNPASALQSLSAQNGGGGGGGGAGPGAGGAPQQRRTMSGTKRGYEDQSSNDDAYTTGVPASASAGSGGDRMFKRLREGRDDLGGGGAGSAGGVGNESYGDNGAGLDAHAYGNGRGDRGPVGKVRSHVEGVWRT